MENTLTSQEIHTLFEALDALEQKAEQDGFMNKLIGSMIAPDDETREKWREEDERKHDEEMAKMQEKKEQIILLKAKLIGMKDRAFVDSLDMASIIGD